MKHALLTTLLLALLACSGAEAHAYPQAPDEDVQAVARGSNGFAAELHRVLVQGDENLVWSPASVHTALLLAYAGARGTTAEALGAALQLPREGEALWAEERVHAAFGALVGATVGAREGGEVRLANALWGQAGYDFVPGTLELLETYHGAGLRRVDFHKAASAREVINDWIEDATRGHIRDLLPDGVLGPLTRLVLTNAIYFKARWSTVFAEGATKSAPFRLLSGERVEVPTMHGVVEGRVGGTDAFTLLELPYRDGHNAMIILLPAEDGGLPAVERALAAGALEEWLDGAGYGRMDLALPRFELRSNVRLDEALGALGLGELFSDRADLSGFNGGREALFLDAALHEAWVKVDEEGTEAAAATALIARVTSVAGDPVPVKVDHPFLFLVRNRRTGQVLFLGRVTDPRS